MKKTFRTNTDIWEAIYKTGGAGALLKYPCEDFVVSLNRYCGGLKGAKLLYVGFGSGNNLLVAAEKGFDCYGVEVSASAVKIAHNRLKRAGLRARLSVIADNRYPFPDDYFDVVVAWHVLSYNDHAGLQKSLLEIKRVLKPAGRLLATFPTYKEDRAARGRRIAANTFVYANAGSNQAGAVITAAKTKSAVRSIFKMFSGLETGYSEITAKGITNSHWLISGTKDE
ncbi:MAG TPA: class I SAM-dependent methyltransferase [Candidatus Omnitrophota bacterium]|nr:class I SAM-dependent methyltransferase [Candidatus Omnitrophota bacterium]HRZ15283.1 class I SAM-dependent methyltransferase [Candidatus Omnitrophota bacterium]